MNKERLSIGIFVDSFFPMIDGVVIAVDNYATKLSKDHNVIVFTVNHNNEDIKYDKPYKVVTSKTYNLPFAEYRLPMPKIDRSFMRKLKDYPLDIIHIHSPFGVGAMGARYAKKNNIPLLSTYHSQYEQDFQVRVKSKLFTKFMMRRIMRVFNKCDLSYSVNRKVKDVYREYGSKVKTVVRNNGTDLNYFEDEKALDELRIKLGVTKDDKVLLFVGRIDDVKNIFFIMDALNVLNNKGMDFKMIWVGTGPDVEKLKQKAIKYKLDDKNIFTGKIIGREEISKYYAISNLFVFPSLYDSSSLVQIEAASQKTPSIFIEGAVTADTVEKNINGYTSENNVNDFADEIKRLFENNEQYNMVCKNAHKDLFVKWDKVVMDTLADYNALIEKYNE